MLAATKLTAVFGEGRQPDRVCRLQQLRRDLRRHPAEAHDHAGVFDEEVLRDAHRSDGSGGPVPRGAGHGGDLPDRGKHARAPHGLRRHRRRAPAQVAAPHAVSSSRRVSRPCSPGLSCTVAGLPWAPRAGPASDGERSPQGEALHLRERGSAGTGHESVRRCTGSRGAADSGQRAQRHVPSPLVRAGSRALVACPAVARLLAGGADSFSPANGEAPGPRLPSSDGASLGARR